MTQALNLANFANNLNSSGQVSAAGIQSGLLVPSGANSLFYNSTAPLGYTQITSLNDYSLRIVSGTGGSSAGSVPFSTLFTSSYNLSAGSLSVSGLSVGATTLSTAQMPSHNHLSYFGGPSCSGSYPGPNGTSDTPSGSNATSSTGGGGSHTHSISGGTFSGNPTGNFAVQYANFILCSKN